MIGFSNDYGLVKFERLRLKLRGFNAFISFLFTVDGSLSDTAVSSGGILMPDRHPNLHRPAGGAGGQNQSVDGQNQEAADGPGGMGKKSNSTTQLSAAGKNEYPHCKFIECSFCRLIVCIKGNLDLL